jgi:hypothetical protein
MGLAPDSRGVKKTDEINHFMEPTVTLRVHIQMIKMVSVQATLALRGGGSA